MTAMGSYTPIFLLIAAIPGWAQNRYTIEPNPESHVKLRVAKTGLYSGKVHEFDFPAYSGSVIYDSTNPSASRVEFVLEAAAIKLKDRWLNEGDFKEVQRYTLEDMLDARQHPQIKFVSSSIVSMDASTFKVGGDLTIRGRTKPVVLNVTMQPAGTGGMQFQGKAVVKLTDFGLKPPKAALGLIGTKNEMDLDFFIVAAPAR